MNPQATSCPSAFRSHADTAEATPHESQTRIVWGILRCSDTQIIDIVMAFSEMTSVLLSLPSSSHV